MFNLMQNKDLTKKLLKAEVDIDFVVTATADQLLPDSKVEERE